MISANWRWAAAAALCAASALSSPLPAASQTKSDPLDWPHWRGPEMNGISRETNLPESLDPNGETLLWRKEEYATRSTPVTMNGRLYAICRHLPETTQEGEKVVCLDPETGELIWEAVNNVYLSDAPAERVGWSSVVADPESGNVFALGLGTYFQALDGETGKPLWNHSMSEEYGMLSTYGGRTNFPVVFEDLVIISGVMTGWGELSLPAHRFVAFDKNTGEAAWIASTRLRPEDTTYSTPVLTVFDGQAALVVGAGDGSVYALQPRTGKTIWEYEASNRGLNTTMLVHDGIVYGGHAEQNAANTNILGAAFAFDGRAEGKIAEGDLLWKIPRMTIQRSAPLLVDGRLYLIEDGATLYVLDPKTGKPVHKNAKKKLGRIMFGSAVYGDGKIYVAEQTGRLYVLEPSEDGVKVLDTSRVNNAEIFGSPMISHGRVFLPTTDALYAFGNKGAKPSADERPRAQQEEPAKKDDKVAQIQIVPAEAMLQSGKTRKFEVRGYNANGQFLDTLDAELAVSKGPGEIDASGTFTTPKDTRNDAAIITAKVGDLTATARVRVFPPLPWSFDFNDKQVPVTWIGAAGRHKPAEVDGESALVKVSTIPKGTRSQSWMGPTDLRDYTVQADFKAAGAGGKLPDMGLINQRYTLDMMGTHELQIRSWVSRLELRFAKTIPFQWQGDQWYTMKFQSANQDGKVVLRGKVWPRDTPEPDEWLIEAADETPNTVGSPGLFGNATDAEFYVDNVQVYANDQKAVATTK